MYIYILTHTRVMRAPTIHVHRMAVEEEEEGKFSTIK